MNENWMQVISPKHTEKVAEECVGIIMEHVVKPLEEQLAKYKWVAQAARALLNNITEEQYENLFTDGKAAFDGLVRELDDSGLA